MTKAPAHLSNESRRLWKSILKDYDLDDAALMILTSVLESRDRREQARQLIEAEGPVQVDRFGQKKPHPAVGVERDAANTMMKGWKLLNFDVDPPEGV